MLEPIENTWSWIKADWREHPLRFTVEVICWLDSMATATIVAATVPNLPYHLLYPLWIGGTLLYAWCAWSRGSFGMLATFLMIATIDTVGWLRIICH